MFSSIVALLIGGISLSVTAISRLRFGRCPTCIRSWRLLARLYETVAHHDHRPDRAYSR